MSDQIINNSVSKHINNLYLDPNNYRFVDSEQYKLVTEENIFDEKIQQRTRSLIEGSKRENIRDLLDSLKANGYLKVDVIQLKECGSDRYLVLEGNRRVTALKCLYEDHLKGYSIGKLNPDVFQNVPAVIYDDNSREEQLIIMGLKHISGNKKWAPINQAKLIYDYLSQYEDKPEIYTRKETELCESLGITKQKLRTSQRAYHLINEYKDSDFGDQFVSEMYSIFEEIVKKSAIKTWIGWNDRKLNAENFTNKERLFSWISKTENDEGELDEPIITKATDIRDLVTIIDKESALQVMEEYKNISKALQLSGQNDRATIDKAITNAQESAKTLSRYVDVIQDDDFGEIEVIEKTLRKIIPQQTFLKMTSHNATNWFELGDIKHFTSVTLNAFKKFENIHLDKLNRINIFAGPNNSGKTSILEAVYLLCNQNDLSELLYLNSSRCREYEVLPKYLDELLDSEIGLEADFNDYHTKVIITKYIDEKADKRDDYLSSIKARGMINDQVREMKLHLYERSEPGREYQVVQHLCRSFYSSPYYTSQEKLINLYNNAVENKVEGKTAFAYVIEFMKKVDPTINNIMLRQDGIRQRFIVDSTLFQDRNVELSSYGEGVARIFEMALCMASCRNGVLLIDEFETAIHYSLLVEFTQFVQELAVKFNTQVFLTTHSKECVDAFVNNHFRNGDISAYRIQNEGQDVEIKQIDGENLESLVHLISFDIRGGSRE